METDATYVREAELPENLKKLWLKALSACELRNFDFAISLLRAVLKDEPKFLDGRKALRKAASLKKGNKKSLLKISTGGFTKAKVQGLMKKDPQAAIDELEKVLEKDPYSISANDGLFDAAMMANMPETAGFALETIKEGHPDNTKNLHKLAEHYIKQAEPENAQKTYDSIVRLDPTDMDAIKGAKDASAQASMAKQRWDEKTDMKDLLADGEEAARLEDEGRAAMTKEQLEARIAELGEQYEERKEDIGYAKTMAGLYEKLEDLPNAIQWYEWAFSLSSQDPSLERRIAILSEKHGELELQHMEDDIAADPDSAESIEKKGILDAKRRERSLGLVVDAKARVDKNPTDKQLRFELGQHLYNAGELTDAIPHLQQAKMNPHLKNRAMLLLGRCFASKGMMDMAASQFREASDELPTMDETKKELLYELGNILEKMGDSAGALECWKEIYEVDYGYLDVAQRVESSYGDEDDDEDS